MVRGDSVVLNCPHCGKAGSYQVRNENANQVDNCPHCRKNFYVCITNGQVKDVRR